MPETIINATAVAAGQDAWTLGAGVSKVAAVALPDDDDTSYIYSTAQSQVQGFTLSAEGIPTNANIIEITHVMRVARHSASNGLVVGRFRLQGQITNGSIQTTTSNYQTFRQVLARPGGGHWSVDDLSSLTVEIMDNHWLMRSRCTTIYVVVNWVNPAHQLLLD